MALFAFDGTWNEAKTDDDPQYKNTNVFRFYSAYHARSSSSDLYVSGVGTRYDLLGKVIGGVFGAGELPRIQEAYDHLCETWASGDHAIDVVGFSRGAATTLDFCHMIRERGIRRPGTKTVVEKTPQIRFLGLWDTVASFGLSNLGIGFNIGHHLALPAESLRYCFHALALDERRPSFVVTRLPGACEVWFRGVHSDIGGGNGNRGLNDITLRWMLSKANAAGLPVADDDIAILTPDANATPRFRTESLLPVRHISLVDRRHYTVSTLTTSKATNPPDTCVPETMNDERTATALSAGLDLLPEETRSKINVLVKQAEQSAKDAGVPLGEAQESLFALIQNRIRLVQSPADVLKARQSTANLVATMIKEMHKAGMMALNGYFLTAALFRFSSLYPYLD